MGIRDSFGRPFIACVGFVGLSLGAGAMLDLFLRPWFHSEAPTRMKRGPRVLSPVGPLNLGTSRLQHTAHTNM